MLNLRHIKFSGIKIHRKKKLRKLNRTVLTMKVHQQSLVMMEQTMTNLHYLVR